MKVWNGFGSEHSANLVMIGSFKELHEAETVERLIDRIIEQLEGKLTISEDSNPYAVRYDELMRQIMQSENIYSISPTEFEQFGYEVRINRDRKDIVITTDELEISAFLKLLIQKGGRVEVFSAHDYPNRGHER